MPRAAAKSKGSPAKASPAKKGKAGKVAKPSPTKTKKVKKIKDPNAPKRGMSAYMLWLKDNRLRLSKPGLSVTDVSKAAGVEWNALKDKSKWEKAAVADKARYEKEIAAYNKKK